MSKELNKKVNIFLKEKVTEFFNFTAEAIPDENAHAERSALTSNILAVFAINIINNYSDLEQEAAFPANAMEFIAEFSTECMRKQFYAVHKDKDCCNE